MKLHYHRLFRHKAATQGDTIVEVLIAIAIAAFAIGISYATAERSLDQSITAQEHNEALNIIENQINDLRVRFRGTTDNTKFSSIFANPSGMADYCLDTNPASWNPYPNGAVYNPPTPNLSVPPYNSKCQEAGQGFNYYYDIHVFNDGSSAPNSNTFKIFVQWERIGGGQTNSASIYYKLNNIGQ